MRFVHLSLILLGLAYAGAVVANDCQTDNQALRSMESGHLTLHHPDGGTETVPVKVARTLETRAAGFQFVCESVIESMPILFLFEAALIPNFHMNNVVAPIDIAFIRDDSSIDSIRRMRPYVLGSLKRPRYSSDSPIVAALEGGRKFFKQRKISKQHRITWQIDDTDLAE